ncbi:LOW QUALITY PROTEIN: phenoloxidase 2-like [Hyalella azteca]|uniref:LOW QUALITY PROTEIN: phenoloxidase 2-like n=1 Tax=Hyalella azteca TaxID=294128 RepID=A0A979FUB6_HYAAZ|nr:LOW QUALITY PROTEIN: phenoloxidase 2-like [Hyalella azteca]
MATASTEDQRDIMYLFERPSDPLYMPRAGNTIVFNTPDMPDNFAPRFGGTAEGTITVTTDASLAASLPPLVTSIPRGHPYSLNIREHRLAAKDVIELLQQAQTVAQLRDMAASIREDINETLFVYSMFFVLARNKRFRGLRVPTILEVFPDRFIPSNVLDSARAAVNCNNNNRNINQETPVVIQYNQDFSGLHSRLENRLAYWREDYGVNAHHWHWHLVYPNDLLVGKTIPDRKGELFYYMHQQIVARYDNERMSIGLPRVVKLDNFHDPIPDGYFSKLRFDNADSNTNRVQVPGLNPNATHWGTRQDNTRLSNYTRLNTFIPVDISELELWRDRLLDGIHQGFFINKAGNRVPLSDEVDITDGTNKRGIDIIGDTFEADMNISANYDFYGDLHNFGHVVIASSHDPDGTHGENLGVMSESTVAMRDPVFYRWHKYVDWIFQQYKATQPTYTVQQVACSRISLQHLNHKPFDYHILVNNTTGGSKQVYVRIFLAPKFSQSGTDAPMRLSEQRLLWIEMDKFVFLLKVGQNHIKRPSSQSSVTIPGEITFRDLEQNIRGGPQRTSVMWSYNFCGCGWPHHLLVPRGRPEGMTFQLFVMMTDYEQDRMPQREGSRQCAGAASYCGVLDERYPDRRPMGFPFDRLPPRELRTPQEQVLTIEDLARLDNMAVHDVVIRFLGEELPTAA